MKSMHLVMPRLGLSALLAFCAGTAQAQSSVVAEAAPPTVITERASVPSAAAQLPAAGPDVVRVLISPDQETTLVAAMAGRIGELSMTLGSSFKKDAVLAAFDCGENLARSKIARAELRAARENHGAKTRLKALQAAGDVEVNLAAAAVDKSVGQVELSQVQTEQCSVKAPFGGQVARIYVKQFQGVNVGAPLADIISDGPLKVRLNAPSRWLGKLSVGVPFEVAVDETGRTYTAKVSAVGARVDAAAQSIEIEGQFDEAYPGLLAGMSGTVRFAALE
ncbi:efflux RND transporter periplasmic adaptor subunit [Eoetvoesiella caeni]